MYTLDALINCHERKHAFHVPDNLMPLTNGILDLTKNFIKQHHSKLSLFANVGMQPSRRGPIVYIGMILDFVYFVYLSNPLDDNQFIYIAG